MTDKTCNGHYCQGRRRPLSEFYTHKSGPRSGKPFSECIKCWRWRRNNNVHDSDWAIGIPVADTLEVVDELRRRIGPHEASRRAGLNEDYLSERRRVRVAMRLTTYERLVEVLEEARERGEDGFDPVEHNKANLIPGGPPGAREKANRERLRRAAARKKFKERAKSEWAEDDKAGWPLYLAHIAERNKPDMTPPDSRWWVWTGMEWLPRYGAEMLGADF